jgi:hypothetical protein
LKGGVKLGQQQTSFELYEHLKEQIYFLKSSCSAFDNGFKGEAKRLAVVIRVLVHDTKSSKSLLGLLSSKGIYFYNTALPYDPKNLVTHMGLIGLRMNGNGSEYWPPLDDGPPSRYLNKWLTFEEWWDEIVIHDHKNEFSRRNLVLAVSNKDGGAHIDPNLNQAYSNLTRNNSLGWNQVYNGTEAPIRNPELASIRQIAHEMLKTLENKFPTLFSE